MMNCPTCSQQSLKNVVMDEQFKYKEITVILPNFPILKCDNCGESYMLPWDEKVKYYDKFLEEFRSLVDKYF